LAHLTAAQKATLNTDVAANTATIPAGQTWTNSFTGVQVRNVPRTNEGRSTIAGWYNQTASPNFWVWLKVASTSAVGAAIKLSDVGNLTTANSSILQAAFQIRPGGFTPSNQDDRALFGNLFSVAGASGTRANLLTAWQRLATFAEKLFATGTGTQATGDISSTGVVTGSPAILVIEGVIHADDVLEA
jgi:hypothetical protein